LGRLKRFEPGGILRRLWHGWLTALADSKSPGRARKIEIGAFCVMIFVYNGIGIPSDEIQPTERTEVSTSEQSLINQA
jgi:hypothetical protein